MDISKIKEPEVISLDKPIIVLGLTIRTGMKSVFKDVTKILKQCYEFEYKNEKMFNENPHYIDLYVAVNEKSKK